MTTIDVKFRGQNIEYHSNSQKLFDSNLNHAIMTVGGNRSVIVGNKGSIWKNNKKITTFKISNQ